VVHRHGIAPAERRGPADVPALRRPPRQLVRRRRRGDGPTGSAPPAAAGRWTSPTRCSPGGLAIDDRRAWERDLLTRYLETLAKLGVTPDAGLPTFGQAWLAYRQQTWHAFVFWIYTIGAGRMQPAMQPEAVSRANLARMAAAIDDLESLDAVRDATR